MRWHRGADPLQRPAAWKCLWRGLRWGLFELGPTLGLYLGVGILLSALVMAFIPAGWISHYLGGTSPGSPCRAVRRGAVIYVCAVGHIPLVATLLAAGASPGVPFLMLWGLVRWILWRIPGTQRVPA